MDTVIFATHLIEYAFVGVSLSIGKFMGGEYLNEFALVNSLVFNAQKKHVLKQAVICAALGRLCWSLWK